MFDIGLGISEILVLAVVGLIVIGPKDLPHLMYQAGKWLRQIRGMAEEVQSSIKTALHEEEIKRLKEELHQLKASPLPLYHASTDKSSVAQTPPSVTPTSSPEPKDNL